MWSPGRWKHFGCWIEWKTTPLVNSLHLLCSNYARSARWMLYVIFWLNLVQPVLAVACFEPYYMLPLLFPEVSLVAWRRLITQQLWKALFQCCFWLESRWTNRWFLLYSWLGCLFAFDLPACRQDAKYKRQKNNNLDCKLGKLQPMESGMYMCLTKREGSYKGMKWSRQETPYSVFEV